MVAASESDIGPSTDSISANDLAVSSSITMAGPWGRLSMSKMVTTCGSDTEATALASRMVRWASWSTSDAGIPGGKSTSLMATGRLSTSSWAAHTFPIAPLPTIRSNR